MAETSKYLVDKYLGMLTSGNINKEALKHTPFQKVMKVLTAFVNGIKSADWDMVEFTDPKELTSYQCCSYGTLDEAVFIAYCLGENDSIILRQLSEPSHDTLVFEDIEPSDGADEPEEQEQYGWLVCCSPDRTEFSRPEEYDAEVAFVEVNSWQKKKKEELLEDDQKKMIVDNINRPEMDKDSLPFDDVDTSLLDLEDEIEEPVNEKD